MRTQHLPKILLLGVTSIIGFNLARLFPVTIAPVCTSRSRRPLAKSWPRLLLDDSASIAAFFREHQPTIVLYCDAVCDVEKCEENPLWAREINVENVRRVLQFLPAGSRLVYVSSDHVFGGDGIYTESAEPCPISVYGGTRVSAETLVRELRGSLIVRAGLPIGPSLNGKTGHRDWLRYRTQKGLPVTVIADESRSAVWVEDLAGRLFDMASSSVTGLRHITATRAVARPELADYLCTEMAIARNFQVASRHQQKVPHLGRVELATEFSDAMSQPLKSPLDNSETFENASKGLSADPRNAGF